MKLEEFFKHYERTRRKWYLLGGHTEIRAISDLEGDWGRSLCPITAVCFLLTKKFFYCHDWRQACLAMGLSVRTGHQIQKAADKYGVFNPTIRERLLKKVEKNS